MLFITSVKLLTLSKRPRDKNVKFKFKLNDQFRLFIIINNF